VNGPERGDFRWPRLPGAAHGAVPDCLGAISKNQVSHVCRELRARYATFCAKSLAEIELLALFLDAIYLPTRPSGAKEGVLVGWGYTTAGERVPVSVPLG
jgi:transposase-like protein